MQFVRFTRFWGKRSAGGEKFFVSGNLLQMSRKSSKDIFDICYYYAEAFTDKSSALSCCQLRPNAFKENDPLHVCEAHL